MWNYPVNHDGHLKIVQSGEQMTDMLLKLKKGEKNAERR